jgi:short-subunit dehydrogenase
MTQPKVVLITGCSSGIGEALALAFKKQGHMVHATARRQEALSALASAGMATHSLEVTDETACKRVVDDVVKKSGRIDVLVNNAGYGAFGPLAELPLAEMRRQLEVNVVAPLGLIQKVAPVMARQKGGLIVNIGSVSGVLATPFSGAYCASKAALHLMSDALRMELAPFGIRVVIVQPGAITSRFGEGASASAETTIRPDSLYAACEKAIRKRATLSQQGAMDAGEFASGIVALLDSGRPLLRLGPKSALLPFLERWLPVKIRDRYLARKFGLQAL